MFNWEQYIINYPDLQLAGINTKEGALRHYKLFGKKEGRNDNINNITINDNINNKIIISNNKLIIQSGIGDLLFLISLLKSNIIEGPLYINLNVYMKNIHSVNNILENLNFKIKLIEKLNALNDIIFFKDDLIIYSNWENTIPLLKNYNILHDFFTFRNNIESEYLVFHTKCRFYKDFNYKFLKKELKFFYKNYKSKYKIIIMGERIVPDNYESKVNNITTIYNELLQLKNNNDILDLSIKNIYDNLKFDSYLEDLSIIHNAKVNILVGHGGSYCTSLFFGKKSIVYTTERTCGTSETVNNLINNNINIHFELTEYINNINSI